MGCYVDEKRERKDACVMSPSYSQADTYYLFNHVEIEIAYHSGSLEDWGQTLKAEGENSGRLVCKYIHLLLLNTSEHFNHQDLSFSCQNQTHVC